MKGDEKVSDWVKNPYVAQMDKFVGSLESLSKIFLKLEKKQEFFTQDEADDMYKKVVCAVCEKCPRYEECTQKEGFYIRQMLHEVFCTAQDYGAELNVEMKRGIQARCERAPRFIRSALDVLRETKNLRMWNQKIAQSREGCVVQMDSFARMIQHATKELDASMFSDEHLEKKLKNKFLKHGLKLISTVFFVTEDGRYEIHVTAKVTKGQCIEIKEVAALVSDCVGRQMEPAYDERPVLGTDYNTVVCVENTRYYTLQGIAKIGKGCEKISGDTFSMIDMRNGKKCMILSDGMGAGEEAYRESMLVVELLEELLEAGFPKETALQMLNTALVMGREDVRFSTVDMCEFDLYSGKCELTKAGASMTFIKKKTGVEIIKCTSLPLGVISKLETENREVELESGDIVIMVTDGILDSLPTGEQEFLLKKIIEGTEKPNLTEFAHYILEQVLVCSGQAPMDDMTVLVAGIWSLEK